MFYKASRAALACALALSIPVAAQAKVAPAAHHPNILLIIADDVGTDLVTDMYPGLIAGLTRQYGPQGLNNPNFRKIDERPASVPVLQQFAQQSMVFSQAWANPFCSPTRASLLTGLYTDGTDVETYADPLSQHHHSFVQDLHDAGYATGVFGKWHMAGLPGQNGAPDYPGMKPREAGFDYFRGNMHAALPTYWNYPVQVQDAATAPGAWRTETATDHALAGIAPTKFADVGWAATAIDWIAQQRAAHKPWFTWLAFNLAHATAIQTPSAMMVPNEDTLDATSKAEMRACGGQFGTQNTGTCSGEALMRAMTNAMDTIVGRVLAAVANDPDTYVIFIGDNGTPMYGRPNLDFIDNLYITRKGRGKSTAFESGAHVAMAIRGPGIRAGARSDAPVDVTDLFPTILQMAGVSAPRRVPNSAGTGTVAVDGVTLMPLLRGTAQGVRDPWRGYVMTESTNLMSTAREKVVGIRNGQFKVVCTDSANNCLFYDLKADPLEEYPLTKPPSCGVLGSPTPQPAWSYCYLTGLAAQRSIVRRR